MPLTFYLVTHLVRILRLSMYGRSDASSQKCSQVDLCSLVATTATSSTSFSMLSGHPLSRSSMESLRVALVTTSVLCPFASVDLSRLSSRARRLMRLISSIKPWCVVFQCFMSNEQDLPSCDFKTFDPKKRMTVDAALEHPYLSAYVRSFRFHKDSRGSSHFLSMILTMNLLLLLSTQITLTLMVCLSFTL